MLFAAGEAWMKICPFCDAPLQFDPTGKYCLSCMERVDNPKVVEGPAEPPKGTVSPAFRPSGNSFWTWAILIWLVAPIVGYVGVRLALGWTVEPPALEKRAPDAAKSTPATDLERD